MESHYANDEHLADRELSLDYQPGNASSHRRSTGEKTSIPWWAITQSSIVLVAASLLVGLTGLHWGGMERSVAVPLLFCGSVLWAVVGMVSVQSYFLKQRVGDFLDCSVLAFLAYSLFSYARSEAGDPARMELMWTWVYAGLFFGCRYGIHSREWMIAWQVFFISICTGICLYALLHKQDPTHLIWGEPRPNYGARISGTFGCPNHYANFLAMGVFSAFLLGTYSRFPWPLRIFFFYISGLLTVGLFFAVSRGGYLAWIFGMTVIAGYVLRSVHVRWWWKALLSGTILSGMIITITRNDFVLGRLEQTLSGDVRLQLVVDAVRIWKENIWFGTGTASFDFYHMRLQDFISGRAIYTHNDYMNTLSDYGAIGLGLVIVFLAALAGTFVLDGFKLRSEREGLVWRLGFCALSAMAIHEVFDFNLHIPACALAFFTLIGMGTSRTFRQRRTSRFWLSAAPLLLIAAAIMGAFITPKIFQTHQGQKFVTQSEDELLQLPREALVEKARGLAQLDPINKPDQLKLANALRVQASRAYDRWRETGTRSLSGYQEAVQSAQAAITIYDRVLETNPLDDTILIKKAMTYDSVSQRKQASFFYAQALQIRPHSGTFHFAVGHHYLRYGQLAEAREAFRQAGRQQMQSNPDIGAQVLQARRMERLVVDLIKKSR